jgi:hypothetical protein
VCPREFRNLECEHTFFLPKCLVHLPNTFTSSSTATDQRPTALNPSILLLTSQHASIDYFSVLANSVIWHANTQFFVFKVSCSPAQHIIQCGTDCYNRYDQVATQLGAALGWKLSHSRQVRSFTSHLCLHDPLCEFRGFTHSLFPIALSTMGKSYKDALAGKLVARKRPERRLCACGQPVAWVSSGKGKPKSPRSHCKRCFYDKKYAAAQLVRLRTKSGRPVARKKRDKGRAKKKNGTYWLAGTHAHTLTHTHTLTPHTHTH